LRYIIGQLGEVRWAAGLERRHDLLGKLPLFVEADLDLSASPLLEDGDHIRDRLVLLRIESLSHHTTRSAASAPSGAMLNTEARWIDASQRVIVTRSESL
jgi:hypothetical protein